MVNFETIYIIYWVQWDVILTNRLLSIKLALERGYYMLTKDDVVHMTIEELSNSIKHNRLSPVDVVMYLLERNDKYNPIVNAFITVDREGAMARARLLEKELQKGQYRGPLHGVPIGLKDLIFTKNMKTTMGSAFFKEFTPDDNATVVDKLEEAGAIIIGKLNTHQFAYGTTGDRSYYGPVKNPYDLSKITGGSSSGSAAAVALNLCYATLGSDTSGSVRIPASCCGVFGMKPTYGRISKYGVFPLSLQLDHVGILSKTAQDNAIILDSLSGYDEKDPTTIHFEEQSLTRVKEGIDGMTVGVATHYFNEQLDPEVKAAIDHMVHHYKKLGANIVEFEIRDIGEYLKAQQFILKSDAYAVHRERLEHGQDDLWDPEVKERLSLGKTGSGYEYAEALLTRQKAINESQALFEKMDVMLVPTLSILPTDIDQRTVDVAGERVEGNVRWELSRFTAFANLIGFPSLSIPVGFSKSGLPIGAQLIAMPLDEATLYRFGYLDLSTQSALDDSIRSN